MQSDISRFRLLSFSSVSQIDVIFVLNVLFVTYAPFFPLIQMHNYRIEFCKPVSCLRISYVKLCGIKNDDDIFFVDFSHGNIHFRPNSCVRLNFVLSRSMLAVIEKKIATVANIFFPFCLCALSFVYLSVTLRAIYFADYTL